ncbi:MAG: triose-phosphate isomerase [Actinobacteria bacterium]|nr:triose-phosphate isomerase [Actinomycetota bacterium]
MKRPQMIAGNWKMNTTYEEGLLLTEALINAHPDPLCEIVLCPPFTHLFGISSLIKTSPIKLGAQTMSQEKNGAFTGEISADMLKSCHCKFVIIGHSERRQIYQEKNTDINQKLTTSIHNQLTPILCIGETLEERNNQQTLSILQNQLKEGLKGLSNDLLINNQIVIAYEPIWAIGTGKVATPDQAQEVHQFIRNFLSSQFSDQLAQQTQLLYGGSVKAENIQALIEKPDIDGALVGGASLTAASFSAIINGAVQTLTR